MIEQPNRFRKVSKGTPRTLMAEVADPSAPRRLRAVAENELVVIVEPVQRFGGSRLVRADDGREWFCWELEAVNP